MNDAKRTPDISVTIDGSVLTLSGSHGGGIHVNAMELSDEIRHAAMMHGLKQKLVDAAAISRNPDTGRSASVVDKFDAMSEVATRLYAGQWNKTRGDGEGTGTGGLLFRALMRLQPSAGAEKIKAFLADRSKTEQAALRATPKIAAIIDELRAAGSGEVDTDALLGELGA